MKRTILHSSILAIILGAGAISSTGCTSVREHRIDVATGQVETVNRKQFIGKTLFNGGRDRTKYVNASPAMAGQAMNSQFTAQGNYIPQPTASSQMSPGIAPQMAPQMAPQAAPQYAPAPAPMSNNTASPFGRLGG